MTILARLETTSFSLPTRAQRTEGKNFMGGGGQAGDRVIPGGTAPPGLLLATGLQPDIPIA